MAGLLSKIAEIGKVVFTYELYADSLGSQRTRAGDLAQESGTELFASVEQLLVMTRRGDRPGAIMVDTLYEEVSVAMPLLNYTTKILAEQTAAEIMSILVKKGATDILTHYGPAGMATGMKWRMETVSGTLGFSLPINAGAVFEILTRDRVMKTNPAARMQQANRTAWRIIKEWILAQMALIETEMVTVEEVFLPYMLTGKQTLYQALSNGDLKMLPGADLDMLSSADIGD